MVTGVGDGSIFIYLVVFLFLYFFLRACVSSPCSAGAGIVAGARERHPKSSATEFVHRSSLRYYGGSSPSRFAPKLRLLAPEPRRFPDSFVSSPFFLAFLSLSPQCACPYPFPSSSSSSPSSSSLSLFLFSGDSVVNGDIRGAAWTRGTLIYDRLDPMDKPVDVNWPEKFNRLPI